MVTAAIYNALVDFFGFLLGLFPTIELPAWLDSAGTYAAQGVEAANGFGYWVPVDALGNAFVFLLVCGAVVFGVRVFRILLSLFTGGGGGAA